VLLRAAVYAPRRMPQFIAAMPGDEGKDMIQIDKMVDTLVQQMNQTKAI